MKTISKFAACGLALAVSVSGTAFAATKVRVKNTSVNPASLSIDGKYKDIRPRKAASYFMEGPTAVMSVIFANGDANRSEIDVTGVVPVANPKDPENTYWCMTIDGEGMEILTATDCEAELNKK